MFIPLTEMRQRTYRVYNKKRMRKKVRLTDKTAITKTTAGKREKNPKNKPERGRITD